RPIVDAIRMRGEAAVVVDHARTLAGLQRETIFFPVSRDDEDRRRMRADLACGVFERGVQSIELTPEGPFQPRPWTASMGDEVGGTHGASGRSSVLPERIVRVAVQPAFARLRRSDHRMAGCARVLRRVPVWRIVAAVRAAAVLAGAQVDPGAA